MTRETRDILPRRLREVADAVEATHPAAFGKVTTASLLTLYDAMTKLMWELMELRHD